MNEGNENQINNFWFSMLLLFMAIVLGFSVAEGFIMYLETGVMSIHMKLIMFSGKEAWFYFWVILAAVIPFLVFSSIICFKKYKNDQNK